MTKNGSSFCRWVFWFFCCWLLLFILLNGFTEMQHSSLNIHFRWSGCCWFYRFWLHLAIQTDEKLCNRYSCSNFWMGKSAITWRYKSNRWHWKNSIFKKQSCTLSSIRNQWYGFLNLLDWFIKGKIIYNYHSIHIYIFITGKIIYNYHTIPICRFITCKIIYNCHSIPICRFITGKLFYNYHSMHICRFITGKIIYNNHSIPSFVDLSQVKYFTITIIYPHL